MRKAINIIQGVAIHSKHVTKDLAFKISSRAEPKEVREMIELSLGGKLAEARKKLDELIVNYGISGDDIIVQMYMEVDNLKIDERRKVELVDKISEYNFRLVEGANERIQEVLLAQIMLMGIFYFRKQLNSISFLSPLSRTLTVTFQLSISLSPMTAT